MTAEQFADHCFHLHSLGFKKAGIDTNFEYVLGMDGPTCEDSFGRPLIIIDISSCKKTREQYIEIFNFEQSEPQKQRRLLEQVPEEFRGALAGMAYERGHWAGDAEITSVLEGLVDDLKKPIADFEKRIEKEAAHYIN